jgi:hypothetical protein
LKLRVGDHSTREALEWGSGERGGLVFAPVDDLPDWDAVENELTEAFTLSREATLAEAPVVYLLRMRAVLGRAGPLDSAVAAGLVAGARALAFEGQRHARYATVIATADDVAPQTIAEAVGFAIESRGSLGQVLTLGAEHLGALLP